MAIFELYSKRQKKLRGEVQIIYIWQDIIGSEGFYVGKSQKTYKSVIDKQ